MKEQLITCPNCNRKFPLSEAMQHEIEERVQSEHQQELEDIKAKHARDIEKIKNDTAKFAAEKAKEENETELTDLKAQVEEFKTKTREFNKKELGYLKREREIKDREDQIKIEQQQFINKKTGELEVSIKEKLELDFKGKLSEKDLKITRLEELANKLQKNAQQGSTEEQGEAFEQELENILKNCFAIDEFDPIPKGKRGADIIHKVKTENLKNCGTIIWEAKNAENWNDNWITKLKDDQRQIGGETVGIIVSKVLPKTIKHFGCQDGIWISNPYCMIGLATAMRTKFQELHQTKAAIAGRSSIMDLIYNYVTGSDFRTRIETTAEALKEMKSDIDKERSAMEKNWAKREKQLYRVVQNIAGVYGDLTGLGANLHRVETFELESGDNK